MAGPEPAAAGPHLAWMRELALKVWQGEQLPPEALPAVGLRRAARTTRGYFSYSPHATWIVVRLQPDVGAMRNTLLHEPAHAVHWLHCAEQDYCECEPDVRS